MTNKDGDECLIKLHNGGFRVLVVIWKEDKRSRGQGLVRAALRRRPGMKWITHIVAQRETMKDGQKRVQACESDT